MSVKMCFKIKRRLIYEVYAILKVICSVCVMEDMDEVEKFSFVESSVYIQQEKIKKCGAPHYGFHAGNLLGDFMDVNETEARL